MSSPASPSPADFQDLPSSAATPSRSAASSRKHPTRRQSSISYLPSDSPRSWSPRTPPATASKRFSLGAPPTPREREREPASAKESRRRSMFAGGTPTSADAAPAAREHADTVLTLAEKHAPLLQFIAQKEARCLELRSQLAVQEAELLSLKQAWERIIRRDFGRVVPHSPAPSSSPSNAAGTGTGTGTGTGNFASDTVASSLGRLLAFAPPASPAPASPAARPSPFRRAQTHTPSASASTTASSTVLSSVEASARLSQSSASSVEPDIAEEDDNNKAPRAMAGNSPLVGSSPLVGASPLAESSGARDRVLRRREREGPKDGRERAAPPSLDTAATTVKRALPPPAGVPGLGSLAAMGLNANVAAAAEGWLGKRISEGGKTFSQSQKRASVLLSDVSQSLFAALSPLTPAAEKGGWLPSPASPSPTATDRLQPSPSPAGTQRSLLDDDDEDVGSAALSPTLQPSLARKPAPAPAPVSTSATTADIDDDWNW